jgi:hypothetical protein
VEARSFEFRGDAIPLAYIHQAFKAGQYMFSRHEYSHLTLLKRDTNCWTSAMAAALASASIGAELSA